MNPNHVSLTGTVQNIFAHRFTLQTAQGVVLADLTPHGQNKIAFKIGDEVTIEGDRKPSEIKVARILRGEDLVTIEHKKKHGADPKHAAACALAAGFEVIGEPRRKPQHFEMLGRKNGDLCELHINLDGSVRHIKPLPADGGEGRAQANAHR